MQTCATWPADIVITSARPGGALILLADAFDVGPEQVFALGERAAREAMRQCRKYAPSLVERVAALPMMTNVDITFDADDPSSYSGHGHGLGLLRLVINGARDIYNQTPKKRNI